MNSRSDGILERIKSIEAELEQRLAAQRKIFRYTIESNRVKFEAATREQHRKLRTGILRFLWDAGFFKLVAAIVIYLQIVPLLLVDLAVTIYQLVCFPIYGITKVAFIFDGVPCGLAQFHVLFEQYTSTTTLLRN